MIHHTRLTDTSSFTRHWCTSEQQRFNKIPKGTYTSLRKLSTSRLTNRKHTASAISNVNKRTCIWFSIQDNSVLETHIASAKGDSQAQLLVPSFMSLIKVMVGKQLRIAKLFLITFIPLISFISTVKVRLEFRRMIIWFELVAPGDPCQVYWMQY